MQAPPPTAAPVEASTNGSGPPATTPDPVPPQYGGFDSLIIGKDGLRAGWSIAIFVLLFRLFSMTIGAVALAIYPALAHFDFSPFMGMVNESVPFLAMLLAVALVALFERRNILEYNLKGPRPGFNFLSGVAAGFLALSALVGALAMGGWLHFGPVALSGTAVFKFGALWACTFLIVGGFEEGVFRCFLQFALARSVNFWWALIIVSVACLDLWLRSNGSVGIVTFIWLEPLSPVSGSGPWGVYLIALLGLFPCLWMQLQKGPGAPVSGRRYGSRPRSSALCTPATTVKTGSASSPRRQSVSCFASASGLQVPRGGLLVVTLHGTGPRPTSTAPRTAAWPPTDTF